MILLLFFLFFVQCGTFSKIKNSKLKSNSILNITDANFELIKKPPLYSGGKYEIKLQIEFVNKTHNGIYLNLIKTDIGNQKKELVEDEIFLSKEKKYFEKVYKFDELYLKDLYTVSITQNTLRASKNKTISQLLQENKPKAQVFDDHFENILIIEPDNRGFSKDLSDDAKIFFTQHIIGNIDGVNEFLEGQISQSRSLVGEWEVFINEFNDRISQLLNKKVEYKIHNNKSISAISKRNYTIILNQGLLDSIENRCKDNSDMDKCKKQRFISTIFHEIGHFVMEHHQKGEKKLEYEMEADLYAAILCKNIFQRDYSSLAVEFFQTEQTITDRRNYLIRKQNLIVANSNNNMLNQNNLAGIQNIIHNIKNPFER